MTSGHGWSDAHEGKTVCTSNRRVSEGPQSFDSRGVDLLSLLKNCQQNCRYTHRSVFGRLKAFDSINIVPCGQGNAKFLKQEPRTGRAKRDNFVLLPLKCQ